MTVCTQPGCGEPADATAPVGLCAVHLVLAADWAGRAHGTQDLLPAPCRLCGSPVGVRYPSGWICAVCEWRHGEVPDADVAPPRVDVVYYLRHGERVKIGTTANPKQRFGVVWHEELLALERGDRRLERRRHEQFADARLGRSEWFALMPALRAHIDVVAGGRDPWDVHARWVAAAYAAGGP